ncbi:iron-sulfur cluster assembly accessory protein [Methylocystis heyeri]|uniref:Iron-sulfur cluster assembly accessory protein n=1 Tax=Methylocystis heyeri TaxID=391905 RepID=A0A6B8K8F6_9HYPH|nr:iron-sulfur cluster assembly accessory protein [Methylocystis heyeri]QGM44286.1 iron-sulfur cluster assembly accessory protein [Methylocystis heyeri]
MLVLTRPAIAAIESTMRQNDKLGSGVRIAAEGGCCGGPKFSMWLEKEPLGDDVVIEIREVRVFLDAASMDILRGATVDYSGDVEDPGFKFTLDPSASQQCGCKSQTTESPSCGSASGHSCGSSAMN